MTTYDEDLKDNPFHQELIKSHLDLIEKASKEGWIICIPRKATITKSITFTDISDHIIIFDNTTNTHHTLNKTAVRITNDHIKLCKGIDNTVKILFKETFYLQRLKYNVYCLDSLLNQKNNDFSFTHVSNLKDCIEFLKLETEESDILNKISDACEEFLLVHDDIHLYTIESLRDLTQVLFMKCLLIALKYNFLEKRTAKDKLLLTNLKVAVEAYMQHCLNNQIFHAICTNTVHCDAGINKATRNLQFIQLNHLSIAGFQEAIATAKCELGKLNRSITTLGKLSCIKNTFKILSNNGKQSLTAEDFMQIFTYLIINLNLSNWMGNLVYLQKFAFASTDSLDEKSFLVTTFEASLEYVKSEVLFEHDNENDSSHNEVIELIRTRNLQKIEQLFNTPLEVSNKLCHPLCTCKNCESSHELTTYSPKWCDDKGRNGLHIACLFGFPHVVDFFLQKGVEVQTLDYLGSAPIHYAASRGHQNALLLLLHSGADLNVTDGDGNSALHLASLNGHDSCVKALLYYSEHINKEILVDLQNSSGNTALHLAVTWGYLNIIRILLQYDASVNTRNHKNKRVTDLCQNYYIKKLMLNGLKENKAVEQSGNDKQENVFGVRAKNLEQFKRTELLLKAIENNDLPLSCFYLGTPVPSLLKEEKASCHPLCSCKKCQEFPKESTSTEKLKQLNGNTCDSNGFTPLHAAAKFGRKEILRLLLDAGANVNVRTYKLLYSPLHLACINQRLTVVKELVQCGNCDIDARDVKGNTGLHYACFKNDSKIVEMLLVQGCNTSLKNNDGKTALQEAEDMSLVNLTKLIKDKSTTSLLDDDIFL